MRVINGIYYLIGALSLVSAVLYAVRMEPGEDPSRRIAFLLILGIAMLIVGRFRPPPR
jgi:hypothetical protein